VIKDPHQDQPSCPRRFPQRSRRLRPHPSSVIVKPPSAGASSTARQPTPAPDECSTDHLATSSMSRHGRDLFEAATTRNRGAHHPDSSTRRMEAAPGAGGGAVTPSFAGPPHAIVHRYRGDLAESAASHGCCRKRQLRRRPSVVGIVVPRSPSPRPRAHRRSGAFSVTVAGLALDRLIPDAVGLEADIAVRPGCLVHLRFVEALAIDAPSATRERPRVFFFVLAALRADA